MKNFLNLIKKQEQKPKDLNDKKFSKLDKKTKRKTSYLLLYIFAL